MKKLLLLSILLIVGCEEPSQHGCLDSQACNYDADATIDNNSCIYEVDCAGVCGGDKLLDNCEVCDSDTTNDNTTCIQDCNAVYVMEIILLILALVIVRVFHMVVMY